MSRTNKRDRRDRPRWRQLRETAKLRQSHEREEDEGEREDRKSIPPAELWKGHETDESK